MRLMCYSHKPAPRFQGTDSYYLGIELETEAPSYEARRNGLELQRSPKTFYAKSDGSLADNGWELVTHPIARNEWLSNQTTGTSITKEFKGVSYTARMSARNVEITSSEDAPGEAPRRYGSLTAAAKAITGYKAISGPVFFGSNDAPVASLMRMVSGLRSLSYTSHEGGRCGLHVHVSRTAFGERFTQEYYQRIVKFDQLVNGPTFLKLSQRDPETGMYPCQQQRAVVTRNSRGEIIGINNDGGRRKACNHKPRNTIEVRIFRGNLREDRIRKAVEAVIAAVEYVRDAAAPVSEEGFLQYVKDHKETYRNLRAFLNPEGKREI